MLPVMTTAVGLSGSPASAALVYSGTMFALDLCISLITGVYIPAVSAYVAILAVNTAIGNDMLKRLAACVKWLITGSLKLLLTLFFFYITISGSVSHGMDAGTVKAAKFALNSSLPLVGQPAGRCVLGSSFGGVAALSAAYRSPDTYGSLVLMSGSFVFTDIGTDHGGGPVFDPVVKFVNRFRAKPRCVADPIYIDFT